MRIEKFILKGKAKLKKKVFYFRNAFWEFIEDGQE